MQKYRDYSTRTDFYLTNHKKVAIGVDDKEIDFFENETNITALRQKLLSYAKGNFLETCIGTGRNINYYPKTLERVVGLDWVSFYFDEITRKNSQIEKPVKFVMADIHDIPFENELFDTVLDTFGLECAYDIEKAYSEIKRVCKKGGKILLLERGKSLWEIENCKLYRDAIINFSTRGQVYLHNYGKLIERDNEVKVIKKKRKMKGKVYYYVLEKL